MAKEEVESKLEKVRQKLGGLIGNPYILSVKTKERIKKLAEEERELLGRLERPRE